jgi:hypothetical protein
MSGRRERKEAADTIKARIRRGNPEVLVPSTSRSKVQMKVDYSNVRNIEKKKEDILSRIFERNPIAITNTT